MDAERWYNAVPWHPAGSRGIPSFGAAQQEEMAGTRHVERSVLGVEADSRLSWSAPHPPSPPRVRGRYEAPPPTPAMTPLRGSTGKFLARSGASGATTTFRRSSERSEKLAGGLIEGSISDAILAMRSPARPSSGFMGRSFRSQRRSRKSNHVGVVPMLLAGTPKKEALRESVGKRAEKKSGGIGGSMSRKKQGFRKFTGTRKITARELRSTAETSPSRPFPAVTRSRKPPPSPLRSPPPPFHQSHVPPPTTSPTLHPDIEVRRNPWVGSRDFVVYGRVFATASEAEAFREREETRRAEMQLRASQFSMSQRLATPPSPITPTPFDDSAAERRRKELFGEEEEKSDGEREDGDGEREEEESRRSGGRSRGREVHNHPPISPPPLSPSLPSHSSSLSSPSVSLSVEEGAAAALEKVLDEGGDDDAGGGDEDDDVGGNDEERDVGGEGVILRSEDDEIAYQRLQRAVREDARQLNRWRASRGSRSAALSSTLSAPLLHSTDINSPPTPVRLLHQRRAELEQTEEDEEQEGEDEEGGGTGEERVGGRGEAEPSHHPLHPPLPPHPAPRPRPQPTQSPPSPPERGSIGGSG